jgi:hypothetical protein
VAESEEKSRRAGDGAPWFKFHAVRWLSSPDVRRMTPTQRGFFIDTLAAFWVYGEVPIDPSELHRFIHASGDRRTLGDWLAKFSHLFTCAKCGKSLQGRWKATGRSAVRYKKLKGKSADDSSQSPVSIEQDADSVPTTLPEDAHKMPTACPCGAHCMTVPKLNNLQVLSKKSSADAAEEESRGDKDQKQDVEEGSKQGGAPHLKEGSFTEAPLPQKAPSIWNRGVHDDPEERKAYDQLCDLFDGSEDTLFCVWWWNQSHKDPSSALYWQSFRDMLSAVQKSIAENKAKGLFARVGKCIKSPCKICKKAGVNLGDHRPRKSSPMFDDDSSFETEED